MKKILCILLLLTFVLFPKDVFAATEGFSINKTSITINNNETGEIEITAYNAIGDVTITSLDSSVVEVETSFWDTGTVDSGQIRTKTIVLKGKSAGKATIKLVIDGAKFTSPATKISETKEIEVTVVENIEPPVKSSYTVTYNANEGENAPNSQTKEEDKTLTLHTSKPTREGYEFTEWNTKKDGSGKAYKVGEKYEQNNNIILYAQWKEIKNAEKNPETGDTMIYIVLLLTLGALIYSYWYMKKAEEN